MDETASAEVKNFIEREQRSIVENDGDLTDANFFEKAHRLSWETIKSFIIDTLCRVPLPGDRFIVLRKMKREDKTTVTIWVNKVNKVNDVKRDIDKMGAE